jgi:hypothetical protein
MYGTILAQALTDVTWPQAVTAIVAVLAFVITLYNFYQQHSARSVGVRLVVGEFKWLSEAEHYLYEMHIKGFNQREGYTGFHNLTVRFLDEEGNVIAVDPSPRDSLTGFLALYLNLPPGQWTIAHFRGGPNIDVDADMYADLKSKCAKVLFRATFPGNVAGELDVPLDGEEVETTLVPGLFS